MGSFAVSRNQGAMGAAGHGVRASQFLRWKQTRVATHPRARGALRRAGARDVARRMPNPAPGVTGRRCGRA
eukprot:5137379-Alexandrium_andersonii.AAC.1